MIEKKASFGGEFRPKLQKGEFVIKRSPIGVIFLGEERKQLANATGQIKWIQDNVQVEQDEVICKIDETIAPPVT